MFWIPNITTIILAWLVQCVILSRHVWFKGIIKHEKIHFNLVIKGLRKFIFVVFTFVSLVFIDTNVKLIFFGIAGYGNFIIHIPAIILTFVLSFELIVHAFSIAPNLKGIIISCIILIFFLYWFEFFLSGVNLGEISFIDLKYSAILVGIFFPILIGLILSFILTCIGFTLKRFKPANNLLNKNLLNPPAKLKRTFNARFDLILWVLITAELILNLQGLSLLFWTSFLF